MFFKNTREELEYDSSGQKIYSSEEEKFFKKVSESEMATLAWPLVPLMNFAKDAYKTDNIYLSNQGGDDPINCSASFDYQSPLYF